VRVAGGGVYQIYNFNVILIKQAPSPPLWCGGLAGAFMVPCGCMGIRRSGGAMWMLCWLAAGGS